MNENDKQNEPVAKLKQWYDENQNLCRQFEMLKPEWEGEAFAFEQAPAQKVEPDFKAAYMEWHDKTEWVQEKEDWPFSVLGMHRADAMKKYIEHLEGNRSDPAVAVNEQLLEVVKRYLSNLEVQEFENVRYDRCGDFAHHVCSSCSARKFPNGEKEPHASTCGWFDRSESLRRLVAAAEAEKAKGVCDGR